MAVSEASRGSASRAWLWVVPVTAAIGWVWAVVWSCSTIFLSKPVLPDVLAVVPIVLMVPFFVCLAVELDERFESRPLEFLPDVRSERFVRVLTVATKCLMTALVLLGATGLAFLVVGQPEIHGGLYYANDYGKLARISEGHYNRLRLDEQRLFLALPAFILLVGVNIMRTTGVPRGSRPPRL